MTTPLVIVARFNQSSKDRLIIPWEESRNMRDIGTTAKIRRFRTNKVWDVGVGVVKNEDENGWNFTLEHNWDTFVVENEIEVRDRMKFKYYGKSVFVLVVYGDDYQRKTLEIPPNLRLAIELENTRTADLLVDNSNNPAFQANITPSCVRHNDHYLVIPLPFAELYMDVSKREYPAILRVGSDNWQVSVVTVYDEDGDPLDCSIQSGILPFVTENNLREGDVCVFELLEEDPWTFDVTSLTD